MIDTAIILAGGLGTRLRPLTNETPKPMLPIKGKPILQHAIENLKKYGTKKIIISIGYKADQVKDYFGNGQRFGLEISYADESLPLGTGGAVKKAASGLEEPFFLVWGDNLMDINWQEIRDQYYIDKSLVLMSLTPREDVENFGVAKLDGNRILHFVEKPKREDAPSNLINAGAFIIDPRALDILPEGQSSMERDCFEKLAPKGEISAYVHEGQWFPTDTLEKYGLAEKNFEIEPHKIRTNEEILTSAPFKSFEWANEPIIAKSLFREYDLRDPTIDLIKGGKTIKAGINTDGFRILGQAYGTYVQKRLNQKKMVVSNDYRSYSRGLAYAFITGALSTGIDVIDLGMTLTPILYFSQHHFNLKGGAMITASHNDNGWSGVKLAKDLSKTFEPEDILEFQKLVYSQDFLTGAGNYQKKFGITEIYTQDILDKYQSLIGNKKLKVVVNTANGGAGEFLPKILERLGFEVIKADCELDWDFPKFNPNPENIKFLEELGRAVREHQADLGISADGDGDRFGVVDEKGREIFSDRAGLFIGRYLSQNVPNKPIVIDVKSTGAYALDPVLKKNKTQIIFSKTGHSYVKAKSHELDALAGFEKSGHFFLRQGFGYGYDDACLSSAIFCTILSQSNLPLSELISQQAQSYQSPTMSPSVADDKVKYEIIEKVAQEIQERMDKNEKFAGQEIKEIVAINGARVVLKNGSWGLVRASSNQPTLVVVAESFSSRKNLYEIFEEIQNHLEKHGIKKENYDQLLPPYLGEDREIL